MTKLEMLWERTYGAGSTRREPSPMNPEEDEGGEAQGLSVELYISMLSPEP